MNIVQLFVNMQEVKFVAQSSINIAEHNLDWCAIILNFYSKFFFLSFLCFRVHEGRKLYKFQEGMQQTNERILCLSLSRKRPVLKWEKNMAWPGKLTLTDKALYFEVFVISSWLSDCAPTKQRKKN